MPLLGVNLLKPLTYWVLPSWATVNPNPLSESIFGSVFHIFENELIAIRCGIDSPLFERQGGDVTANAQSIKGFYVVIS